MGSVSTVMHEGSLRRLAGETLGFLGPDGTRIRRSLSNWWMWNCCAVVVRLPASSRLSTAFIHGNNLPSNAEVWLQNEARRPAAVGPGEDHVLNNNRKGQFGVLFLGVVLIVLHFSAVCVSVFFHTGSVIRLKPVFPA